MADLGLALNTVISSLNANQQALSMISGNIANANSENYTRREIVQSSQVVNGVSAGVHIEAVRRAVDDFVVSAARRQISSVGQYEVQSQYYDRLSLYLGQPGDTSNINAQFDSFFARVSELSNSPEQTSLRSNTLQSALTLTSTVAGLATNIEQMRFDIDQQVEQQVEDINTHLQTLDSLNLSIKNVTTAGGDITALLDSRDRTLSDLSKIMDVNITFEEDGRVTVFLPRAELLSPTTRAELSYIPSASVSSIISGVPFGAINLTPLNPDGTTAGSAVEISSASNDTSPEQSFASGSLKGLLDMRDTELPQLIAQLDELAKTFSDAFNAIHNDGVGFPPPSSLTGTRVLVPTTDYNFSGSMRIALLNSDGSPVDDSYGTGGLPPLTLDLDTLTSTGTPGQVDLDAIVREINTYFGPPPATKATLGPLDDLRLGAVSSSVTSTAATGSILFSGNLGAGDTIRVGTQTFTMVAGTPTTASQISLGSTLAVTLQNVITRLNTSVLGDVAQATYTASGTTLTVTYDTAGSGANGAFTLDTNLTPGATGSTANINGVGAAVNPAASAVGLGTGTAGVDASGTFTFDVEMTNLSGDDATFEITDIDVNGGGLTGQTMGPFTSTSGLRQRTNLGGASGGQSLSITLPAGLEEGDTFTVSANIRVTDSEGTITTDTVTFTVTVPDPNDNILNTRYPATASVDADTLSTPTNNTRFATARIVDANGNPVAAGESGYLQIISNRSGTGLAIDEIDSAEGGTIADPTATETGRGFSHFFGLNDFFVASDDVAGSAINFAVRGGYATDPSKLATAGLARSNQPSDVNANPIFTYEIGIGSNQVITRLGEIKSIRQSFDAAGGLSASNVTFGGYSSEILSFVSLSNQRINASLDQEQTLYNAFKDKLDANGGVNIDEELANTVLFQNNFNASARLITIISDMLDKMIQSF